MDCGSPMVGDSGYGVSGKIYYYYTCKGRKLQHNGCKKRSIKKSYLEDYIVEKTQQYMLQPKYLKNFADLATNIFNENIDDDNVLASYKEQLDKNQKEIDNIVKAIKGGFMSSTLQEGLSSLEEKKTKIEAQIVKEKNVMSKKLNKHDCEDFFESLMKLDYSIDENKKLLIQRFIKRIDLGDNRILIHFYPIHRPFMYWKYDTDFGPSGAENGGNGTVSNNMTELSEEFLATPPNVNRTFDKKIIYITKNDIFFNILCFY